MKDLGGRVVLYCDDKEVAELCAYDNWVGDLPNLDSRDWDVEFAQFIVDACNENERLKEPASVD